MFTKKSFTKMTVKRLASAKGIFRLTKENIRLFEDDPNFSDIEIESIKELIRSCDNSVNNKIINSGLFDDQLEKDIIKLCEEFQSNFRWTMSDMQKYVASIIDGQALTPIIFGDISKLAESVKRNTSEGVHHSSYKFYKKLLDSGYVYVVIDGNNRSITIGSFYRDEIPLFESSDYKYQHPDFYNITKNAKHYSVLQSDLREHIDTMVISVTRVETGTLEDLGKDFVKVNSQVKLNDQEMRQANVCEFGQKVRNLAKKYDHILRKKVTKQIKGKDKIIESALFTDKFIGRRNVEELIVTISNLLTNGTAKVDKGTLDKCYDGDDANIRRSNKEFHRVEKIFGRIMKWRDKYGRSFLDSNSSLKGNLVDLVWLLDLMDVNDMEIKDERKFVHWFGETQTLKANDISKVNPERQVFEFQCSKGDRDDQGNFKLLKYRNGKGGREGELTAEIRPNTIWMAPDGKPFSYVEIQANLQQNWNELRLEIINDSLMTVPDDIIIQKDSERDFPVSWRYRKWVDQDRKTYSTGEEIPLIDLYNTKLYQMDHAVDHADGGLTSYDNCHLESADYNQSGKYKEKSAFEEIDDLFGEAA